MTTDEHREHHHKLRFLLRSAASLASTTVITAGLGFVYWALAARMFHAASVGEASTAVAAMSLIAPLTLLGLGTLLISELPEMTAGRSTLVSTAALVSGLAAAVVAFGCALALPADFLGLPGIGTPAVAAMFSAAVATQSVGLLLDQALLSMDGGVIQLRRNLIQAVVKLILLAAFALTLVRWGSLSIFASWLLANVVSLAVIAVVLVRRYHVPVRRLIPAPKMLHGMHFDAARHHALNTALLVPYFSMPILANVILGSETTAYFYAAWSVASFVFFIPLSLSTALFASGARDSRTFTLEFRKTLRYSLLACVAANIVIALVGRVVLHIFGENYAEAGFTALIVLCLGGLGLIVKDHHIALARVTGDVGREAVLVTVLSAAELVGAAIGAMRGGLTGLALGWLAAVVVGAVLYAPRVWQTYLGRVAVAPPGVALP
jgi:O-antigen/teichoic acid export membrane protein